jgi:phosphosulfolactate phosphohydrolase-like enzyme
MRYGLRGDTFRDHCRSSRRVYLELGVAGALRAQHRGDVVVVVDAIRASSTITRCLDLGAREVVPIVSVTDLKGEVTIGERGGTKLPGAHFDNSPLKLSRAAIEGKSVVISTTNGTECIRAAHGPDSVVLVGGTNNCSAVARAAVDLAIKRGSGISLVAAGRNNLPAIEDRAAVTEIMRAIGNVTARGTLEPFFSSDLRNDFLESESGANLVALGQADDVEFCARKDISTAVPIFDGTRIAHRSLKIAA